MFFSNSIANKKGFLPRPAPFRAWGVGGSGEVGGWQPDAMRNITGRAGITASDEFTRGEGTFYGIDYAHGAISSEQTSHLIMFDSSRVVPTGPQNVPQHVWEPVLIYLGNPA